MWDNESYKKQIISWIEEAESKAVSDIDFLDIVGKLLYAGYPKMRFSLLKEMIDNNQPYIPTENGICKTTDAVFTIDEVKKFLCFLRDSYNLHKEYNPAYAGEIKDYHNELIDNLDLGGCWDTKPDYIED